MTLDDPAAEATPQKQVRNTIPYKIGLAVNFLALGLLYAAVTAPVVLGAAKFFGVLALGWLVILAPWAALLALALLYMLIFSAAAAALTYVLVKRDLRDLEILQALNGLDSPLSPFSRANPGKAH